MSRSWKLVNEDGEPDFDEGGMDLFLEGDGHFTELVNQDVLDQRVKKATVSIKGANQFDQDYGTRLRQLLGGKSTGRETAATVGSSLENMIEHLRISQGEVRSRIGAFMSSEEILIRASRFRVGLGNTEVQVQAELITEAGEMSVTTGIS